MQLLELGQWSPPFTDPDLMDALRTALFAIQGVEWRRHPHYPMAPLSGFERPGNLVLLVGLLDWVMAEVASADELATP